MSIDPQLAAYYKGFDSNEALFQDLERHPKRLVDLMREALFDEGHEVFPAELPELLIERLELSHAHFPLQKVKESAYLVLQKDRLHIQSGNRLLSYPVNHLLSSSFMKGVNHLIVSDAVLNALSGSGLSDLNILDLSDLFCLAIVLEKEELAEEAKRVFSVKTRGLELQPSEFGTIAFSMSSPIPKKVLRELKGRELRIDLTLRERGMDDLLRSAKKVRNGVESVTLEGVTDLTLLNFNNLKTLTLSAEIKGVLLRGLSALEEVVFDDGTSISLLKGGDAEDREEFLVKELPRQIMLHRLNKLKGLDSEERGEAFLRLKEREDYSNFYRLIEQDESLQELLEERDLGEYDTTSR